MADRNVPEDGREPEEDVVAIDPPTETLEELLSVEMAEPDPKLEPEAPSSDASRELSEMRDRYMRKLAEFENFKKRTDRERADHLKYALTDIFREVIPVLDNFERALAHAPDDAAETEYHQGIEMIYRQLSDALRKRGLAEVPAGGVFDPNLHEAVVRVETDEAPPNTILEVLQKGYTLNDRLLRPAFVKVAAAPSGD
jgi:molecular chaperone GrpE